MGRSNLWRGRESCALVECVLALGAAGGQHEPQHSWGGRVGGHGRIGVDGVARHDTRRAGGGARNRYADIIVERRAHI